MNDTKRNSWSIWSVIAILIGMVHIIPLYITFMIAFKEKSDLSSKWLPPKYISFDNFRVIIEDGTIIRGLMNTTFITVSALILLLIIATLTAYPVARIKSTLSTIITAIVLSVMMIPPLSVLVPLYSVLRNLNLVNTYTGIILVLTTYNLPLATFLMINFLREIPETLEEAAMIDGCNRVSAYIRIIIPQLKPVIASIMILSSVKIWNDYRFALYILQKSQYKTMTLTISQFFSEFSTNLNVAAAAAIIAIVPVVVMFITQQKHFVSGLSDGAIK